jgi:protein-S-isoprenylcysteine O-methyltransferase Ste14
MPETAVEVWIWWLGGVAGFLTLAAALWGAYRLRRRAAGRMDGSAAAHLTWPHLMAATALYAAVCVLLWRPLPIAIGGVGRIALTLLGAGIYFPSLLLYAWGLRTLGVMFGVASGFGVRLYEGHRLVTTGPYSFVRHPMYLAVMLAGLGGLLLYRTWAMLFFSLNVFGLVVRARREERAMGAEFGAEWTEYARRVPSFVPRLGRKKAGGAGTGPQREVGG